VSSFPGGNDENPHFANVHRVHARVLQEVEESEEDKRLSDGRFLRVSRHVSSAGRRKREKRHVPVASTIKHSKVRIRI
jgi:hypothetical protein